MKELLKKEQTKFGIVLLILVGICFGSIVLGGDDWIWNYAYEFDELEKYRMPNGRYLSNILTYLMVRYVPIRFVLYIPILLTLIWLLCRGMQHTSKHVVMWSGLLLFCLMPGDVWGENVMWMSAFPVYSVPLITVLVYLHLWFSEISGKAHQSKLLPVGTFLMGIAGALCVEHMTMYSCLLAVFVLVYAAAKKDLKIRPYQIAYLIGTALGTVLMFTNHHYHSIQEDGDSVGTRSFEFAFSDVFYQMYHNVIPRFAKQFSLIHILIAASFFVLYLKTDRSQWKPERKRYAKLTLLCELLYSFYSFFVNSSVDLENLTPLMRVAAFEAAFVFLYLVSIIYLAWILLPRMRFIRITLFTLSSFVTSAVFCIVNPVTARCFFSDYCFWLLCALELLDVVVSKFPDLEPYARKTAFTTACFAVCFVSYINIVNKVSYDKSILYLREQGEKRIKKVEVVEQPYPTYTAGSTLIGVIKNWAFLEPADRNTQNIQWFYIHCMELYYGFHFDHENFGYRTISFYDYNM